MDEMLTKPGRWEIRTTIYRNGRKVATCDALGDSYLFAVESVGTNLERGDITPHTPRTRRQSRRQADG